MEANRVGAFIEEERKKKNLTQAQLAEKLQTTEKAVNKWENGKTYPDIYQLPILAKIFEVSIEKILAGQKISSNQNDEGLTNIKEKYLFKKSGKGQNQYFPKKSARNFIFTGIVIFVIVSFIGIIVLGLRPGILDEVQFSFYLDAPRDEYDQSVDYFVGDSIVFHTVLMAETTRKNVSIRHPNATPFQQYLQATVGNSSYATSVINVEKKYSYKTKMNSFDESKYIDYKNKRIYKETVTVDSSLAGSFEYTFTPVFQYNNKYYEMESQTVVINIKEREQSNVLFSFTAECVGTHFYNDGLIGDLRQIKLTNHSGQTINYYNLLDKRFNIACLTQYGTLVLNPLQGFMTALPTRLLNRQGGIPYSALSEEEEITLSEAINAQFYSFPINFQEGDIVVYRIWVDLLVDGHVERVYAPDICSHISAIN